MWTAAIESRIFEPPEGLGVFQMYMREVEVVEREGGEGCGRRNKHSFDEWDVRSCEVVGDLLFSLGKGRFLLWRNQQV